MTEIENININTNNIEELIDSLDNKILFDNNQISEIEEEKIDNENDFLKEIITIQKNKNTWFFSFKNLYKNFKFVFYYISLSTFIFIILLIITNYNAYSKIIYTYINPDYLKNANNNLIKTLNESKIKIYAENIFISEEKRKEQEEKIIEKLKNEWNTLKKIYFSPKKLISYYKDINLDLDIIPYENRILIPKIGKNVPLVDVNIDNKDIKNIDNIFMNELSKWVIRHPKTWMPWKEWNVFIFWHSSNYPWIKWDYNDVFALLDNLYFWDEVIIYYNQKKYVYIIKEKKVIKPWNNKILSREEWKKELTLMTCWPVWTTLNRLIVIWELKEIK